MPSVPISVTTSILYSVPPVRPETVMSSDVLLEPVVARLKAGFESGLTLMTENRSKLELDGVVIPLPLMMIELTNDRESVTFGVSGSEILL